jgi:methionyl-tRNA formyltransferase
VLRDVERSQAVETPQEHEQATFAAKIAKEEGEVTFPDPALVIYNRFRAFDPWPGLFVSSAGESLKLTDVRIASGSGRPRAILSLDEDVVIACGDGALRVVTMQRPGKPRGAAGAIARGLGWKVGEVVP